MSACTDKAHKPAWRVDVRRANFSAFSGGRRTPSPYSQVRCGTCGAVWRTKAAYVDELPGDRPSYSAPVAADETPDDACIDGDGNEWPEHDESGETECRRCGAELEPREADVT